MKNKKKSHSSNTHDIQKIMSSYCRYIDSKNWQELNNLFTQNARMLFWDAEGNLLFDFKQPHDLVRSAQEAIGKNVTLHHLHNAEISFSNEHEAVGIWAMEDRFYLNENAPHPFFHGAGYYHIRFTYFNDEWKISELCLQRLRLSLVDHPETNSKVIPILA